MKRILVVDDMHTARLKTELVLRQTGRYIVQSVQSGADALKVVRDNALPDAVVLDIEMAGLDGIATMRALRGHCVKCVIIAYTSRKERVPQEFERLGFDAYVPKLESMSGLIAMLQILLNQQQSGCSPCSGKEPSLQRLINPVKHPSPETENHTSPTKHNPIIHTE